MELDVHVLFVFTGIIFAIMGTLGEHKKHAGR